MPEPRNSKNMPPSNDLVIVAAGKGEMARLFETDTANTPFTTPMRALALTYVKKMVPRKPFTAVAFNLIPGVGEYFVFPALTTTGACEIMVFEGVPDGPMDCWADVKTPAAASRGNRNGFCRQFLPWEAERCRDIEFTDDMGIVAGRFPPTVRKPVCKLPSGRLIMGMGDVVVVNDPITGQGSNTASKAAKVYMDRILANGNRAIRCRLDATNVR